MPPLASAADLADRAALVAWIRRTGPHVAAGLMAADPMTWGDAVVALEQAGLTFLHFDVMDGVYCPAMTAGPGVIKAARTRMLKDVHLMIADPLGRLDAFLAAGADIVHVQAEGTAHLNRLLKALDVAVAGCQSGRRVLRSLALEPGTPIEIVRPVLHQMEMVTLLAVDPGWSGGAPDAVTAARVEAVRVLARAAGTDPLICIDGGITPATWAAALAARPDVVVSGSALFAAGASVAANLDKLIAA